MEDGVWRTIRGHRVFIKNKQSVKDAIKESGKFEKASDISRNELKNIEAELSEDEQLKQDRTMDPVQDKYTRDLEGKHIEQPEATKEYKSNFLLEAEVNDFDAAQQYLTSDDMSQYLPKELQDVVTSVDWTLDDESSGHVSVKTTRDLTDSEKTQLQDWIDGQNSDGLGEGFEQQKFAETYYNPYTGDGPYTYNEAENEITDMFDRMDPSDYSDYLDETMVEDAIDTYIADAGYDSNDEEARENARAEILDNPEDYLDWETIDNAKNDAIQGNDEYNVDSWYNMSSIRRNGDSFEETDLKPAKEDNKYDADKVAKYNEENKKLFDKYDNEEISHKEYNEKSNELKEKHLNNKEDNIDDYRNMGSEEGIASYMDDKGVTEEEAYKKLYSKEINDYKNSAPDDAVAEMSHDFGISEEKANKILYGDDDYEYNLYKQSKENPDSINPMTEWSTDWEALDEKYRDRYEKEKSSSSNEDNISKKLFNEASKIDDPLDRAIQMQVADDVGKVLTDDSIRFRAENYIRNNYNGNATDDEIYEKLKSAYKNNGSYQEENKATENFDNHDKEIGKRVLDQSLGDKKEFLRKMRQDYNWENEDAKRLYDDINKTTANENNFYTKKDGTKVYDPHKGTKYEIKYDSMDDVIKDQNSALNQYIKNETGNKKTVIEKDNGSVYAKPGRKWEVLEEDTSAYGDKIYKVKDEQGNVQWKPAKDFETSNNKKETNVKQGSPIEDLINKEGINVGGRLREVDNEAKEYFRMLNSKNLNDDDLKNWLHSRYPESNKDTLFDKYNEFIEQEKSSNNKNDDWVKDAYKKYLKEHPKSKISLSDFMKKNK